MKIAIRPTIKAFKANFDPEGQTTITIRQASTNDLIHMDDLFKNQTQIWEDGDSGGTIRLQKEFNPQELKRERAFLTLVGIDLEDEDGNPIFRFRQNKDGDPELAMGRNDFFKAWGKLPPVVTEEIHDYVRMMTPSWNPNSSGE